MNLLYGLLALCGSSGLGALLGTVLSIAAIVPLERRKVWGDVGLVLNGTILLGYCGVIGLLVLALLSGQP
jgi:hypothetical protein